MRNWKGILVALTVLALAATAQATTAPSIGVYFDTAATQTTVTFEGGLANHQTAYIYCMNAEQPVGGAAFRLVLDPKISLTGATFPAGVQIGNLTDGIQIGMSNCYPGFFGVPVLLATLTLWTRDNAMTNAPLTIAGYPGSGNVEIADCDGNLTVALGSTATMTVPPRAAIGVYFDNAAIVDHATFNGGLAESYTAYVFAVNTEQPVGGAAFKLDLDPRIQLLAATYPAGVQIGDLATGIQIGMTDCVAGFYGAAVKLATLTLRTGDVLVNEGTLQISNYPAAGAVQIADCNGVLRSVDGRTAYLTIPVGTESHSWSQVKSLYGN